MLVDLGINRGGQLAAVAQHYDTISALLTPAMTGKEGEHYRAFIGDLDKQKEHAGKVLRPVKDEMSKAADEMEEALAAMG